ncbi:transglycosylase domain-containing protein [Brassicibacter mesophilus]|uniref:transglycosylase domain-containing protein n=1 Tax=Brassicibacter mesophilus TaxID=745119 RepID=UPI003D1D03D6
MKRSIILIIIVFNLIAGTAVLGYQGDNGEYTLEEDLRKQISENIPNYIKIDDMPKDLINAIVSVEDRRFFNHNGFDVIGISRAFLTNIAEGEIAEGGSTITQQLAKNLFLSNEKKLDRKLKELVLAVKLENRYTKDEILEMYLNLIYYGSGAYGVQNASQEYYGKNVWELSLEECAMLAGLPQAPSAYNPKKYLEKAEKRQKIVIEAMKDNGYIDEGVQNTIGQTVSLVQ